MILLHVVMVIRITAKSINHEIRLSKTGYQVFIQSVADNKISINANIPPSGDRTTKKKNIYVLLIKRTLSDQNLAWYSFSRLSLRDVSKFDMNFIKHISQNIK